LKGLQPVAFHAFRGFWRKVNIHRSVGIGFNAFILAAQRLMRSPEYQGMLTGNRFLAIKCQFGLVGRVTLAK